MARERQVTRDELYELVWDKPILQIAEEFGISDVAVGKMCRRMNVPVPGRGYWARVDAGAKLPRTPLPKKALQLATTVRPTPPKPAESEAEKVAREDREVVLKRFAGLQVPDQIENPHKLTERTRKHFEKIQKEVNRPIPKQKWNEPRVWSSYSRPRDDKGRYECLGTDGFPLKASFDLVPRALTILDALAKALEGEGFRLKVSDEKKVLEAVKDGEGIAFHLNEGYVRKDIPPAELKVLLKEQSWASSYRWSPSGKLTLTITGREWGTEKRWVDDKRLLESRFAEILATFLDLVPRQKRLRSVREAEAAKRRAQEIVDSERRWKEAEEQREFEEVLKESEAHQSMVKFQQYLDGIEKHITESQEQLSKKGAAWLARMRLRVAETDPFLYRVESLVEKKS